MPLLNVADLHVRFHTDRGDVSAVNGVSFALEPGETLGIVGESGSGKSVTSMAIMGLLSTPPAHITAKEITFEGQDLRAGGAIEKLRGNRISMIFQDPMTSMNPFMRISRQLTEVLEVHRGLSQREALKPAIEMLERVGIPDPAKRIHSYPHEFSGGMRQRVMIAMSLLCEPDLLIADEPTTALDVTIQAQILELLKDLQRERGMATILITHDLGVVAGQTDRILVLYGGRVMEKATASALFATPQHPYTQGLLKSVPRLDGGGSKQLYSIPGLPPMLDQLSRGCPFAARCDRVMDICRTDHPGNRSTETHEVHCHAFEGGAA